ncbi:MAG TPA: histidinol-phosphate transaminase [Pseudomonadales bacterium]
MSCDFIALATPGVRSLQPYQPGKPIEELQRELGITDIIKLASNENPLGAGALARQAYAGVVRELALYPDGGGYRLKKALADKLSVQTTQVTLGNGSNDILDLIGRAFLRPGVSAVFSEHAFVVYPITTQVAGARAIAVPAKNWGHDLDAMASAIADDTRLVFIANPNNPTGTAVSDAALRRFMQSVRDDVIVVLDEAYFEYGLGHDLPDGVALLNEFPNLVVTRTFSKAYGLAALRVGYSISQPAIADVMNRLRMPFNVNAPALAAAEAALSDQAHIDETARINRDGLQQLSAGFEAMSLRFIPSLGNFIAFEVPVDAMACYQGLLRRGVIVRPIGVYAMPHHLRVTVGLPEQNARFLSALASVLQELS